MLAVRFALPRRLLFTSALGLGSLAGCASPPPGLQALAYRPDFSSPEATSQSFLIAWAEEQPQVEYRALSEAWKAEVGGTLDAYLIARPQLQRKVGWVSREAWRLQAVRSEETDRGIVVWWGLDPEDDPTLGIECVSQNYLEFEEAGGKGQRPGSYLDEPLENFYGFDGSVFWAEIEDSAARIASRIPRLRRIELGTEWKIRGLLTWEPPADEVETP
ncbi:MAG: hypothetical protein MK209_01675 [Planctomycetes bacterium]|nr:hypothetical protein [Planctomycetota bacterium]